MVCSMPEVQKRRCPRDGTVMRRSPGSSYPSYEGYKGGKSPRLALNWVGSLARRMHLAEGADLLEEPAASMAIIVRLGECT